MNFSLEKTRLFRINSLLLIFGISMMLITPVLAEPSQVPSLESNTDKAKAGFFKLSWQEGLGEVEIQEAKNPEFNNVETLQPGSDSATVISGKPDGDWYYRARVTDTENAEWSETVKVVVEHHSLQRALFFFFTGLFMFIATCWLVIRGETLS